MRCKAIRRNEVIYGKYIIEFSWGPPGQCNYLLLLGLALNYLQSDFLWKGRENKEYYMFVISELEEKAWICWLRDSEHAGK